MAPHDNQKSVQNIARFYAIILILQNAIKLFESSRQ